MKQLALAVSTAFLILLVQFGSHPTGAVISQMYTLPFEGQYLKTCGFGCYSGHLGTDYQLSDTSLPGHPVTAAARGTVWTFDSIPPGGGGAGYYIVIDHGNGHRTRYLHLASRVAVSGQIVALGQIIGYEGNSGGPWCQDPPQCTVYASPYHLHFEVRHDGTPGNNCCSGTAIDPYGGSTYSWKTNPPSMAMDMDWSGDGYPDVLARAPNGDLCLVYGNGNNGWLPPYPDGPVCGDGRRIGTGWGAFNAILRAGDWSGDGCHDILARDAGGTLYLYYGSCGTGTTFYGSGGTPVGWGWGVFNWLIAPGDFSGDGFMDVLAREADGDLCLVRGEGHGGWLPPYPDGPNCGDGKAVGWDWHVFSWIVEPRDFGGGGCMDVMGDWSGTLNLYMGNCAESWAGQLLGIGSGWQEFEAMVGPGDFTGDGCPDILGRKIVGAVDFFSFRGNCAGGWLDQGGWGIGSGWWAFDKLF